MITKKDPQEVIHSQVTGGKFWEWPKIEKDGKATKLIAISGDLNVHNGAYLREMLISTLETLKEGDKIIIHMDRGSINWNNLTARIETPIEFMDSTGIGALIGGCKRCAEARIHYVLVYSTKYIRELFHHSGLDKLFETAASLQEALDLNPSVQ